MYEILLVIHTIIVVFLIVSVLVQRTDSDGLSGLSGGGGNQFMTGRGSANFWTRTTAILAGLFMLTSLTLVVMVAQESKESIVDQVPLEEPATPAPGEGAAQVPGVKKAPSVPKPE